MAESSKYDLFFDELTTLEKQIYAFAQKCDDLIDENSELRSRIDTINEENKILKQKIRDLEQRFSEKSNSQDLFGNALNSEEKENIKSKLNEMISKIDNHLRS